MLNHWRNWGTKLLIGSCLATLKSMRKCHSVHSHLFPIRFNYCTIVLISHASKVVLKIPGSSGGEKSTCNTSDLPGLGRSAREGIGYLLQYSWASLVAQLVKNLPAMPETWVWSLGWEDPLEKEWLPLQYSGLENSMDYIVHGVAKSQIQLSDFYFQALTVCEPRTSRCTRWA